MPRILTEASGLQYKLKVRAGKAVRCGGSVSNSVEIQFHHKFTKAQSTQRKWHISIEFLGALAFLGVLDGLELVSTVKDTFPLRGAGQSHQNPKLTKLSST